MPNLVLVIFNKQELAWRYIIGLLMMLYLCRLRIMSVSLTFLMDVRMSPWSNYVMMCDRSMTAAG